MGLKFKVAALTEVAEGVRNLYKEDGSGGYVLDADGVVPSTKLDEFRNNNIALQQQLEKLKGVDPTKYAELMELDRKVKEKQLIDAGDVDGVVNLRVQTMKSDYEGQLTATKSQLEASNNQLATLLIDNVVKSAALGNGALPQAMDDVALRAKAVFSLQNGVPVMKDANGNVVYGKDGTTPKTVAEWVVDLRKSAPHLFAGFNGGGATGGRGNGGVDVSKMNPLQKIQMGLSEGLMSPQQAGLPG